MWNSKKKTKKSLNLDHLIILSQLGLFLVGASWFLCYTEFSQVCNSNIQLGINIITLGTLINISMLLLLKNGLRMRTVSEICELILALLYISGTFFVYQQIVK